MLSELVLVSNSSKKSFVIQSKVLQNCVNSWIISFASTKIYSYIFYAFIIETLFALPIQSEIDRSWVKNVDKLSLNVDLIVPLVIFPIYGKD